SGAHSAGSRSRFIVFNPPASRPVMGIPSLKRPAWLAGGMTVTNTLEVVAVSGPIDRFRSDLRRRYPRETTKVARPADRPVDRAAGPRLAHRLEKLPPEIGVLLIILGAAGLLLPGPVGSPFLIAGGISLWPSAFRKVEDWFQRVSPGLYDEGIRQMERFLVDLERRYPGSTR